jgi:hypothetical protein
MNPDITEEMVTSFKDRGVLIMKNFLGQHEKSFLDAVKVTVCNHLRAAALECNIDVDNGSFDAWDPTTWCKDIFQKNAKMGFFKRLYETVPQVAISVDPKLVALVACLTGCKQLGVNFYEAKIMPPNGTTSKKPTGAFIHQDCCANTYLKSLQLIFNLSINF